MRRILGAPGARSIFAGLQILYVLIAAATLVLVAPSSQAQSNCSGQPGANTFCAGPLSGTPGLPRWRKLNVNDVAPAISMTPSTFGAKCDATFNGSAWVGTDDTAAFAALAAAVVALGGNAEIVFPYAQNCLTYNSGQAFAGGLGTLFDFSSGVSNVHAHGNGSNIVNNHTFAPGEALYVFYCKCTNNNSFDGFTFTQANAVSLPAASPIGTVGVWAFQGANVTGSNLTMIGGQAPVLLSGDDRVLLVNVTSTNSIYGLPANTIGGVGVTNLTVINLVVNGTSHDRAVFLKGTSGCNIQVSSLNAGSNDVLISTDAVNQGVQNCKINYTIVARTSGSPNSYITIGSGAGATGGTVGGSFFRNLDFTINADLSGDGSIGPLVKFIKSTTATVGLTFDSIRSSARVTGITNHAGHLFDVFTAADAGAGSGWAGETANNISFENVLGTGSSTPDFYVDYAPFPTSTPGGFVLRNFIMPGNYTDLNNTNACPQRFSVNTSFGNGPLPSCFNNVGVFQGGLIAGAQAQTQIGSSTTDGALIAGNGSSNDFKLINKGGGTVCNAPTAATQWNCGLFSINNDTFWTRHGAANWQLGNSDAPAPVSQILGVQSVSAGTSNTAGADFFIAGSRSTGSAQGGSIVFQTANAGGAGSSQNALATAMRVLPNGIVAFGSTAGATGATNTTVAISGNATAVSGAVSGVTTYLQIVGADSVTPNLGVWGFGNVAPQFNSLVAAGTAASPSGPANNAGLFGFFTQAYNGTSYVLNGGLKVVAAEAQSSGHSAAMIQFFTTPVASASVTETVRMQASGGLSVGSSNVGTNNGNNTITTTTYFSGATTGVTCAGSPTAGFASTGGIVTHC